MRLTERDRAVIVKCGICRSLSTTQIRRLYFPAATVNAVQKRLRALSEAGYLRVYREHAFAEALHGVGMKGRAIVEERDLDAVLTGAIPRQIPHLMGINTIRIALETSGIDLAYFFACWQLPGLGWKHAVIPDAVFAMRGRERFLAEYDRGTEPVETLREKLRAYGHGIPGFGCDAVIFVFEENRRSDLLARTLKREGIGLPCFVTSLSAVERNVLEPIFLNTRDGTSCSLGELSSTE